MADHESIDTVPTDAMVEEAERGLRWREEYGRGGTRIGVARARDIVNRRTLSISTIRRMASFFARHEVDKDAEGFRPGEDGYPSAGRIAWALWSGDPGRAFADRILEQMENAERQVTGPMRTALENKRDEHNEEHGDDPTKRVTLPMLEEVFRRGVGAYKTNPESVRPSVKNPETWALSRVNSFLYAVRNERFRSGKHDTDLFPEGHPLRSDDDERAARRKHMDGHRHILDVEETDDSYIVEFAKHAAPPTDDVAEAEPAAEMEEESSGHMPSEDDDEKEERESAERVELITRAEGMDAEMVNDDDRRVRMSISSEAPVERGYGTEILEHSEDAIDLEFLRSGHAPLLLDHDHRQQIGVIESVELDSDARRLRALVRFGRSALAEEILRDVQDGIRSNVSIGYTVEKMEKRDGEFRAVKWRVLEASIVAVPADDQVGVNRARRPQITVQSNQRNETMEAQDIQKIEHDARKAALKAADQILQLAARHNRSDLGHQAIAEGRSYEEFSGQLLEEIGSKRALQDNSVGLTQKEKQQFSIKRAIMALANPMDARLQEAAAFEFECSRAATQQYGRATTGIMLPQDVLGTWRRDMNTTDDAALFTDDFRPGDFIEALRNASSVMSAGATMLRGLSGDVKIPKQTGVSTAGFISSEGGASSESEMTVGSVSMTPKTCGVHTELTRELLIQSSLDIEQIIRDDLSLGIATAIDKAALEGSGSSGNPTGILNTTGVGTVTNFAAANPTFSEVVSLESAVANANGLRGNSLAYILPTAMHGALKTTERATNTASFVIEPDGRMNGYPAVISNQATAGNLYFGNFADVLVGFFGGLDITVDPFSLSKSGKIVVTAMQSVDVAVRHAESFAFGNDG